MAGHNILCIYDICVKVSHCDSLFCSAPSHHGGLHDFHATLHKVKEDIEEVQTRMQCSRPQTGSQRTTSAKAFQPHCYDSFHAWSRPRPCVCSTPDQSLMFHRERAPRRVTSRDPLPSCAPARRANASWYARPLEVRAGSLLPAL